MTYYIDTDKYIDTVYQEIGTTRENFVFIDLAKILFRQSFLLELN
jgi:hypothetical protein